MNIKSVRASLTPAITELLAANGIPKGMVDVVINGHGWSKDPKVTVEFYPANDYDWAEDDIVEYAWLDDYKCFNYNKYMQEGKHPMFLFWGYSTYNVDRALDAVVTDGSFGEWVGRLLETGMYTFKSSTTYNVHRGSAASAGRKKKKGQKYQPVWVSVITFDNITYEAPMKDTYKTKYEKGVEIIKAAKSSNSVWFRTYSEEEYIKRLAAMFQNPECFYLNGVEYKIVSVSTRSRFKGIDIQPVGKNYVEENKSFTSLLNKMTNKDLFMTKVKGIKNGK